MKNRAISFGVAVILTVGTLVVGAIQPVGASVSAPFDSTFGTDGMARLSLPLQRSYSYSQQVVQDGNGKLLTMLQVDRGMNPTAVYIRRYNAEGTLDTSFGSNGQSDPLPMQGRRITVLPQSEKIIVSGYADINGRLRLIVRALTSSGDIDESFGVDGSFIIDNVPGRALVNSAALLAATQDRIFVGFEVGNSVDNNNNYHIIALRHSGRIDDNWALFGGREIAPRPSGSVNVLNALHAMTVMSDGSLLVLGTALGTGADTGKHQAVLVKLNSNGYFDQGFDGTNNGNGIVRFNFASNTYAMMTAMTVLGDDSIVLAGYTGDLYNTPWHHAVMKVLADGSIDTGFGTNGFTVSTVEYQSEQPQVTTIARDLDGRFVIAYNEAEHTGFLRFEADGTIDSSQRCAVCSWSPPQTHVDTYSAVIQSDGKMVIAGANLTTEAAFLVRLNLDGTKDDVFAVSSIVINEEKWAAYAFKSVPQSDGSIITVGQAYASYFRSRAVIFKLTANGQLDQSFGQGGYQFLQVPTDYSLYVTDMLVQPDGKILTMAQVEPNGGEDSVAVWRTDPNGSIDTDFGNGGGMVFSEAGVDFYDPKMVLSPTGKIVVSATARSNNLSLPWVYRFHPDGTPDITFTDSNNVAGGVQPTAGEGEGYADIIVNGPGDHVYIAGRTTVNGADHSYLVRLRSDGTVDPAFASGRKLWQRGEPDAFEDFSDITVDPNGVVTVLGWRSNPSGSTFIVQLTATGEMNTSFNGTGQVAFTPRGQMAVDYQHGASIVSTSSGHMVAGGGYVSQDAPSGYFTVGKFTITGALDNTFGTNGVVVSPESMITEFYDVALVSADTYIFTGYVGDTFDGVGLVMRIAPPPPPTTTAPPPTTAPPATTTTTEPPIRLVVTTTQAAILRRLKMTVPRGSKVTMASRTARVCRVSGTRVLATATGRCRITVTVTAKNKKRTSRTLTITVS
jgi:uncharacterized delta-60 repeat protein